MTTEQIIQRLLDEKHITVAEAIQMIKDLVRNEVFTPMFPTDKRKTYPEKPIVVMYGVGISNTDGWNNTNSLQGTSDTASMITESELKDKSTEA